MSGEVRGGSDTVWLEEGVRSRLGRRISDFRIVIQDQGIVLRGRAPSYYAKQLAQHAVMRATDLVILANEITVIPASLTPNEAGGASDLT